MMSKKQIDELKKNIDELSRSSEQFVFILYKDDKGDDHLTSYSYNVPLNKLKIHLMKLFGRGKFRVAEK